MSTAKYQVLARKYRPQLFADVVGQEAIVTTLKNALKFDKVAHAYLFCGSRGVGKTTLARLFAKALNCQNRTSDLEPCNQCPSCVEIGTGQSLDVIEIDGASNRGIDDIRQINDTIAYAPSLGGFKIYIIDEVHMLTKEAFNALLKTLEEPPEKAKFFFATTEAHKVLPTIISRCQRFDLGRIQIQQIMTKLEEIGADLGRTIEPEALHLIASFSEGSLRDAESLLDQILCFAEGVVTEGEIRKALGLISQEVFFALDLAFSKAQIEYAFHVVESLFFQGKNLPHFFEQLIEHVRLLTLAKTVGIQTVKLPQEREAQYLQSAQLYTSAQLLYLLDYLLKVEQQIQRSASPRVSLEATLLHYIQSKHRVPVEVLVRRLAEIEEKLGSQLQNSDTQQNRSFESVRDPDSSPTHQGLGSSPEHGQPQLPPQTVSKSSIFPDIGVLPLAPEKKSAETKPIEPPALPKVQVPVEPKKKKEVVEEPLPPKTVEAPPVIANQELPHPRSHYDTLIRFAAVELEGTVKI